MSTPDWAALGERAARLEREQEFSGILRATRGHDVLWESCHGLANRADGVPVTPRTRFATASLSKLFTAVGVLEAAGRGELALDDAVVDLLPPHRRPGTLRADVTVHHLLSHTSGIADYYEEDEDLPGHRADADELWAELPTYLVRDYTTLLPLFADLPPICPPGTAFHYSNAGYVLLGILLSHVSGMPFAEVVGTRVLAPAGMADSGYPALDEVHPNLATGYLRPREPGGPWRTNIYSVPVVGGGDGGAFVTAADVDRFLCAVRDGGVWPGVTPQQLLTPRFPAGGRWSAGYGGMLRDDGVLFKDGGDPGVSTFARFDPTTDTRIVLLANVDWDETDGIAELVRLLVETAGPP
ncbi:serine hydrolase [Fodinibacter luteus]|uniref:Serine hydrolase n=1 Tax=Fodinibacter luteus TaxID=552064 RepID=A0ABP8K192_9MICO